MEIVPETSPSGMNDPRATRFLNLGARKMIKQYMYL